MTDLAHLSDIPEAPQKSHDITIMAVTAIVAIALIFVLTIYRDPSNLAPSDPVPISFFP